MPSSTKMTVSELRAALSERYSDQEARNAEAKARFGKCWSKLLLDDLEKWWASEVLRSGKPPRAAASSATSSATSSGTRSSASASTGTSRGTSSRGTKPSGKPAQPSPDALGKLTKPDLKKLAQARFTDDDLNKLAKATSKDDKKSFSGLNKSDLIKIVTMDISALRI